MRNYRSGLAGWLVALCRGRRQRTLWWSSGVVCLETCEGEEERGGAPHLRLLCRCRSCRCCCRLVLGERYVCQPAEGGLLLLAPILLVPSRVLGGTGRGTVALLALCGGVGATAAGTVFAAAQPIHLPTVVALVQATPKMTHLADTVGARRLLFGCIEAATHLIDAPGGARLVHSPSQRRQSVSSYDLGEHEALLLVALPVGAQQPREVVFVLAGLPVHLVVACLATLHTHRGQSASGSHSAASEGTHSIRRLKSSVSSLQGGSAVNADDKAALVAGPVEVEKGCLADVAHLSHLLDHPLPHNLLVCREQRVREVSTRALAEEKRHTPGKLTLGHVHLDGFLLLLDEVAELISNLGQQEAGHFRFQVGRHNIRHPQSDVILGSAQGQCMLDRGHHNNRPRPVLPGGIFSACVPPKPILMWITAVTHFTKPHLSVKVRPRLSPKLFGRRRVQPERQAATLRAVELCGAARRSCPRSVLSSRHALHTRTAQA
ncbi:hypothetical protein B566_EDAN004239 [Ephemera danica]|nr:hypothetical protein B566_EDAN004239 [Ephemera danica]